MPFHPLIIKLSYCAQRAFLSDLWLLMWMFCAVFAEAIEDIAKTISAVKISSFLILTADQNDVKILLFLVAR
ncbi:hypothetical protein AY606_15305 [Acinetobacter sp. SFB]|nr:hypothetical protein AY606_15305 [Acinetobacter sp. SFB]